MGDCEEAGRDQEEEQEEERISRHFVTQGFTATAGLTGPGITPINEAFVLEISN